MQAVEHIGWWVVGYVFGMVFLADCVLRLLSGGRRKPRHKESSTTVSKDQVYSEGGR